MKKQGELKSYQCSLDGEHWSSYNATSRGQAKMQYWHDLDGDFEYLRIRCQVLGAVYTSEEFIRNAEYRGIEFAYCGMVVDVGGCWGIIVGHNDSANLNILFTEGENKGMILNCHPNWKVTYYDRTGNIIKSFNDSRSNL